MSGDLKAYKNKTFIRTGIKHELKLTRRKLTYTVVTRDLSSFARILV
jgi:hypothetical protein